MVSTSPHLKQVFPAPPLVAYRRPHNLRDKLVKARVPDPPSRPTRETPGIKKCTNVFCVTCPYVVPGNTVKCSITNKEVVVNAPATCKTSNIIYCITCKSCGQKYVGESSKEIGFRFSQHRSDVNTYQTKIDNGKRTEATGEHFNLPGHSLSDM